MKHILTLTIILFLATLTLSAQNYSPCYKEKYQQGVTLYNKGDYNGAKAKFVAAKGCPVPNTKEADTWIGKCNARIKDEEAAMQKSEAYNRCPCPYCNGTGVETKVERNARMQSGCTHCGGTGILIESKCKKCNESEGKTKD